MAHIPDLTHLLALDSRTSISPFKGQHGTILISRDHTNSTDFMPSVLLQHFSRKEPQAPTLLVSLSQNWTNYSASAAKCGFNLRRTQNMGKIDVLDLMSMYLGALKEGVSDFDPGKLILESVITHLEKHTTISPSDGTKLTKPTKVLIDDLSILLTLGSTASRIYQLFSTIENLMRDCQLPKGHSSHLIIQTMAINTTSNTYDNVPNDLNHLIATLSNHCDILITIRPLGSGYSTRVDGTIKIFDNRLTIRSQSSLSIGDTSFQKQATLPLFPETPVEILAKKNFFFKLGDRKVRLMSSALLF